MFQELDMSRFWPKVVQVVPDKDYRVYAYFNDGSVRLFDVKPLIKPGTVFEPLLDKTVFKSKLAVINDTIAWDMGGQRDPRKCVDLDPFVIFEQPAVSDPLCNELWVAENIIDYKRDNVMTSAELREMEYLDKKATAEIAETMLKAGEPKDKIMQYTGLASEEIDKLNDAG